MGSAGQRIPHAVLYSGGIDSTILLRWLLAQGHPVQPLYVDCGLYWQRAELAAVRRLLAHWQPRPPVELRPLVVLALPLADVYGDHWSITGRDVPDAASPDAAVFLPGRNPLLAVKAHVWCQLNGFAALALGCLSSNPFGDATADFFRDFQAALDRAGGRRVEIVRPFAQLTKAEVLALARDCPLEPTFSCLAPVDGAHCGRCNKCAERQAALALVRAAQANGQCTGAARVAGPPR